TVPAISCQHCVRAVTTELNNLTGVNAVRVDLATKLVTIEHAADLAPAELVAAIKEAGYDEVVPA
ncbi:MAG: heavy-metal-associated domain-containing protein, partial [Candidatus Viridilinea halotolerans]